MASIWEALWIIPTAITSSYSSYNAAACAAPRETSLIEPYRGLAAFTLDTAPST